MVYTTKVHYFIAISAGEIKINNETFYAISPNTPIGQLLIGKKVGDEVTFRENVFKIIELV